ncbi:hypothetical protein [Mycobacterium sp. OTB74]|uniref:hypothetical protein n=1 Tax=Mycobacterium sp. OTB74 TaxID=1853452 RepID=UPI002475BD6B|nr:hypothetical protein [Mycobacterium sp. OTB74]
MLTPPSVRYAGYLVAAEGAIGLLVAAVLVARGLGGADQHKVNGFGTALWFVVTSGAVAVAGWALINGKRWGRGIAVVANLLLLGVAYYIFGSHQLQYAIVVALAALATLGLLFSPSTVQWMVKRD